MDKIVIKNICKSMLPKGAKLVYLVRTGSHAYGFATPTSDEDFRGVFIPSKEDLLGLKHHEQFEKKDPDIVLNSLEKFVKLARGCNPNIVEQLFVGDDDLMYLDVMFYNIRLNAKLFLSQLARNTYGGYAVQQIKKMMSVGGSDLGLKRKEMINKFGYDTKNAAHCIRLLIQGREILEKGNLTVRLSDDVIKTIKEIKAGEWKLDQVHRYAEEMLGYLNVMPSNLQEKPDDDKINRLVVDIQERFIKDNN